MAVQYATKPVETYSQIVTEVGKEPDLVTRIINHPNLKMPEREEEHYEGVIKARLMPRQLKGDMGVPVSPISWLLLKDDPLTKDLYFLVVVNYNDVDGSIDNLGNYLRYLQIKNGASEEKTNPSIEELAYHLGLNQDGKMDANMWLVHYRPSNLELKPDTENQLIQYGFVVMPYNPDNGTALTKLGVDIRHDNIRNKIDKVKSEAEREREEREIVMYAGLPSFISQELNNRFKDGIKPKSYGETKREYGNRGFWIVEVGDDLYAITARHTQPQDDRFKRDKLEELVLEDIKQTTDQIKLVMYDRKPIKIIHFVFNDKNIKGDKPIDESKHGLVRFYSNPMKFKKGLENIIPLDYDISGVLGDSPNQINQEQLIDDIFDGIKSIPRKVLNLVVYVCLSYKRHRSDAEEQFYLGYRNKLIAARDKFYSIFNKDMGNTSEPTTNTQ